MIGHSWKISPFVFADEAAPCLTKAELAVPGLDGLGARSALLVFGAYLAAQVVGGGLVGLLAGLVAGQHGRDLSDPGVYAELSRTMAAPAAIVGMLAGGVVLLGLTRYFEGSTRQAAVPRGLGWAPATPAELRLGFAAGALLGLTYLWAVTEWLPPPPGGRAGPLAQMASTPGPARMSWVFLVLVAAPPLEEFLFRGVLFTGLARSWGGPAAALVATGLFVAIHLPETGAYWPAIAAISSVGVSTLVVRIRSQSLAPAVLLHGAYNLVIVLGVLAPQG